MGDSYVYTSQQGHLGVERYVTRVFEARLGASTAFSIRGKGMRKKIVRRAGIFGNLIWCAQAECN